jgi:hypothetical protein
MVPKATTGTESASATCTTEELDQAADEESWNYIPLDHAVVIPHILYRELPNLSTVLQEFLRIDGSFFFRRAIARID